MDANLFFWDLYGVCGISRKPSFDERFAAGRRCSARMPSRTMGKVFVRYELEATSPSPRAVGSAVEVLTVVVEIFELTILRFCFSETCKDRNFEFIKLCAAVRSVHVLENVF